MNGIDIFNLEDRVALVTGAGGGIGKVLSKGLASCGALVCTADIDFESALETSNEITNEGYKAKAFQIDVTSPESVKSLVDKIVETFRTIDILVNCAGIISRIPSENMSKKDWDRIIEVNLTGSFLCCREVAKHMIQRQKGKIINISSMSAFIANKGRMNTAYSASKGGVVMLTKGLASEWAQYSINVNSIAPGYIKTALNAISMNDKEVGDQWLAGTPLGRFGTPEDLVGITVFLASSASDFITGETIMIDGGFTIW